MLTKRALEKVDQFIDLCDRAIAFQKANPNHYVSSPDWEALDRAITEALPLIEQLAEAQDQRIAAQLRQRDAVISHRNHQKAALEFRGALLSKQEAAEILGLTDDVVADPLVSATLQSEKSDDIEVRDRRVGSGLQPVESEWEASLSAGLPDLPHFPTGRASISYRRLNRAQHFADDYAEIAGVAEDDVFQRLSVPEDGVEVSVLENAIEGAMRTSDRNKIRMLARVASAAINGDEAEIDAAGLVLPVVLSLESQHVAVIVGLATAPTLATGGVSIADIGEGRDTVEAILSQLEGRGIAKEQGPMNTIGPPQTNWYLTPFGHKVFWYLVDYPEHPNHQAQR